MVPLNGMSDTLQNHRLAGTRRRNDETPLSFSDRRQ